PVGRERRTRDGPPGAGLKGKYRPPDGRDQQRDPKQQISQGMDGSAFTVGCSRRAPPPSRRLSQIGASESGSDHGGGWWQDSNAGFGLRNTRCGRGFAPSEQHSSDDDQRESRDARAAESPGRDSFMEQGHPRHDRQCAQEQVRAAGRRKGAASLETELQSDERNQVERAQY